eukprot:366092-Chlamydomonas_euryale.AAC.17
MFLGQGMDSGRLELWLLSCHNRLAPSHAAWCVRGQPAHTPHQRPPGAERKAWYPFIDHPLAHTCRPAGHGTAGRLPGGLLQAAAALRCTYSVHPKQAPLNGPARLVIPSATTTVGSCPIVRVPSCQDMRRGTPTPVRGSWHSLRLKNMDTPPVERLA